MKLSILICTIPERYPMYKSLSEFICNQVFENDIDGEVLWNAEDSSIGKKRNELLDRAKGEYVAFVDDDDWVSSDYIKLLMEGIDKGVDCMSLRGEYSVNGKLDGYFEHSLKYNQWQTVPGLEVFIRYERYPNHLNCIKASIAKQFKFPEKNFGEDHDWSKQIHESGLIKTEHYIDQVIYYYKKVTR